MAAGYSDILQHHTLIPWKNDDSERCPPFGIFRVTGTSGRRLKGVKPSSTFGRLYAVNGDTAVPPGGSGQCCLGVGCLALYDTGTPANGEGWGPKPGQWSLAKDYPRIATIGGVYDSTKKIARVTLGTIDIVVGKLAGTLNQGSTATFNVWSGAGGSEAVISSMTITVRDWLLPSGESIASGKKGVAQFINGTWYLTQVECG